MLVGLTAQSLTVSPVAALASFGLASVVMLGLLVIASVTVSSISSAALKPLKMSGSAVRTFSGYVLMAVGVWFLVLVFLDSPIFV